jgi:hypothetical protein
MELRIRRMHGHNYACGRQGDRGLERRNQLTLIDCGGGGGGGQVRVTVGVHKYPLGTSVGG